MLFSLFLSTASLAAPDDYTLELDGYWRMRGYSYSDLYADQEEPGKYMTQRLRIQPSFNFQNRAKFAFMADVLDDVVWGDNQSLASTALFAAQPSNTSMGGVGGSSFVVKRAWVEFDVILGNVRIGRMPSQWGMGLLANAGDGFDDPFGENHEGNNFDRILFATKPIAVAQTLMGQQVSDIPLFVGYAYDRLVEDPLIQYHGYKCESGIYDGDPGYNADCDTNGDGQTDVDHSYTDDSRQDTQRQRDWTFDNDDDVTEHILLAIYRGENIALGGSAADLTAGVYFINRTQVETASNVNIIDGYLKFYWRNFYLEGEYLNISGESSAISLPGAIDESAASPLYKEVDITGYAARAGYKKDKQWSFIVEHGYASGDENVADNRFTGRPLHPDHNVGLLIYDEVLAHVTAQSWQGSASSLASGGGVYNSKYIFPVFNYTFLPGWDVSLGYLHVWPDRPDGANIACAEGDTVNGEPLDCAEYNATASDIGWELDFALKAKFHNHINFSFEAAYANVTDRVPLASKGLNPDGRFFTMQTRLAYEF